MKKAKSKIARLVESEEVAEPGRGDSTESAVEAGEEVAAALDLADPKATRLAKAELQRIIDLLKKKIAESHLNQLQIQEIFSWGNGFVSQTLNLTKHLRLQTLLQILYALEIEPSRFFAELYQWPSNEEQAVSRAEDDPVAKELFQRIAVVASAFSGLVELLADKEILVANESAAVLDLLKEKKKTGSS